MNGIRRQKSPHWARAAIAVAVSLVLLLSVFVVSAEAEYHGSSSLVVASQSLESSALDAGQSDVESGVECHVSYVCSATLATDNIVTIEGLDRDRNWPAPFQYLRSGAGPEHFHPPRLFL